MIEQAAEVFGRYVHDSWGVGIETESCGGAGVLLFLSMADRAVYISKGAALDSYLTDHRLDSVIGNMKEHLRAEQYDTAILSALEDILQYIQSGPPGFWETFVHHFTTWFFPMIWIFAVVGSLVRSVWIDNRRRREYARVSSQLNEIERAQALAMQGKYRAASCPICLEDFQEPGEDGVFTKGSDGQPIKLLRCGHVMDEGCWASWISSGRGNITKCPLCNQDVGSTTSTTSAAVPENQADHLQQPDRHPDNNAIMNGDENENDHNDENNNRMLRLYRRERMFRLARLGDRYPQFIRPAQIQRWSQPTYDGSLVRDPSFVQSNPAMARPAGSSGTSMRSGGFGGSSSGGGRGGRW